VSKLIKAIERKARDWWSRLRAMARKHLEMDWQDGRLVVLGY